VEGIQNRAAYIDGLVFTAAFLLKVPHRMNSHTIVPKHKIAEPRNKNPRPSISFPPGG